MLSSGSLGLFEEQQNRRPVVLGGLQVKGKATKHIIPKGPQDLYKYYSLNKKKGKTAISDTRKTMQVFLQERKGNEET